MVGVVRTALMMVRSALMMVRSALMMVRSALVTISLLNSLLNLTAVEAIKKPYVETYWESWIPSVSFKFELKTVSNNTIPHLTLKLLLRNIPTTLQPSSKMSLWDHLALVLG